MYSSYSLSLLPLVDVLTAPLRYATRRLSAYTSAAKRTTMRLNLQLAVLLFVSFLHKTESANVLIYPFAHCLNSHLLNAEKVASILAHKGHDVTMLVSTDYHRLEHVAKGASELSQRAGDVTTGGSVRLLEFEAPANYTPICEFDTVDFMLYSPFQVRFNTCVQTFLQYCDKLLSNSAMLTQLKQHGYDVFIVEALDPCSRVLADYLDVPFISLVTTGLGHFDSNPRPPSYLPAVISSFTPQMTFAQRLANLLMKVIYETVPIIMGFDPPFEQLKLKYGLNTSLAIADTFKRTSLQLVNSNFAIEYPAPVEPDTILIGGFAIKTPQPLTGELLEFVDGADDGVIVMSFGTLVASYNEHWASVFAAAFARLPQRVVWRFNVDSAESVQNYQLSDNVWVSSWIPQVDLLAHQKTRLFITHCGMNGMYEAAYFGVPVVAVPLSADQFSQASKMVDYIGMGVQVDIETLTADKLYSAIEETLNNSRYRVNAQMVSDRFHDQPLAMSETLAYWVEYVVRHKGAHHLKSGAHHLTWYQYHSIDILLFIFTIVFVLFAVFFKTTYKVYRFVSDKILRNVKIKVQ